ncbi:alpha-amylase/subtilisin inhibitor-like [Populus alba x Populus x berolinensis]|uniref:Alpha-amylase/subtilisin inhibitor-like n=1 Tax=Populus alba x Populus x berolinensis TaxID=444605 RepID=A0AAD6L8B1_9ROSI|nr:alpha-amylase/subtilisin inhibitor-like [Populus alba x Populus x berolinensis]
MLRLIGSLSFIWLLMAISTVAQPWPPVLDADGQPLRSGVEYYVLPGVTDVGGGLTLVDRNGSCPLYVGQEPLAPMVSRGIPVVFTPRVGDTIIRESRDFTVAFSGASTCVQSTAWMVGEENPETRRRYVVTGTEPRPSSTLWYFNIENNGQGVYALRWCPNCLTTNCPRPRCGSAGVIDENRRRLLALDGPAFPFIFRRA